MGPLTLYLKLQYSHPLEPSPPSGPDPGQGQVASPGPGGSPPRSSGTDGSS